MMDDDLRFAIGPESEEVSPAAPEDDDEDYDEWGEEDDD